MEVDLEIDLRLASPILSRLDGVLMLHDDCLKRHYRNDFELELSLA